MKITKLVLLFNKDKILIGVLTSVMFYVVTYFLTSPNLILFLKAFSCIILLNIVAAILASFLLYDCSDLYQLKKVNKIVNFNLVQNAVLVHASFDPISSKIEKNYPNMKLTVCDIFENRHELDKGINISKKVFPPNPKEIKIKPNHLPFENDSQDVILAITAVHEILSHEDRVKFFQESKRIINKEGIIIVSEQFRDLTNFLFFNIGVFHFISENQWKKAIEQAGLKVVKNEKTTPFANMLMIKKV